MDNIALETVWCGVARQSRGGAGGAGLVPVIDSSDGDGVVWNLNNFSISWLADVRLLLLCDWRLTGLSVCLDGE